MNREEYLMAISAIMRHEPGTEHLPATAPVIARYLVDFMPREAVPDDYDQGDNMDSLEIVEDLENLCDATATDVATVMLHLGYDFRYNPRRVGREWMMVEYYDAVDDDDDTDD